MRARTIREGSVGLLILLGIGLFGGLVFWLRGFNPTNRPYHLVAEFEDTVGVQVGTAVLYRGVAVGRVVAITPRSNQVDMDIEITQKDLRIPSQVLVETVETGLIGEMLIEITPLVELTASATEISPVGDNCDSEIILCDGDRLSGVSGPSFEALLRSSTEVANLLADPELIAQLKTVLEKASQTTTDAGVLAKEATALTQEARAQIGPLTASAQTATDSAASAAQQVEGAAAQFTLTATDINRLIGENRGTLVDTLGNVQVASQQLRVVADTLGPTLQSGELVGDLEALVGNASAASADLQAITASLNTPANLVLLQQTLESARDALASAQKVMADVDEITGDPAVRDQLRNLINGLGDLVSSTRSLEQQSEVAQVLVPLSAQIRAAEARVDSADEGAITEPPVLVFDGERYVLQPASRLANGSSSKALKAGDRPLLTKPSR
jgi:phospholipid/cholesterol/gamma-HCH transport system substrate-binding protein